MSGDNNPLIQNSSQDNAAANSGNAAADNKPPSYGTELVQKGFKPESYGTELTQHTFKPESYGTKNLQGAINQDTDLEKI